ncbi:MAG: sulfotransferase family 2 domain-containing protein [Salibacteraceae bacterium]
MEKNIIFVHPLKTGGTTVNSAMNDTYWQTKPDFNYRHILGESGKTNVGNLFDPEYSQQYANHHILTMVRNPIDRVISEYFFMKEKQAFMSLLHKKPKNFVDFIKSTQTGNGMLKFFAGMPLYSTKLVREADLSRVIRSMDEIPVHVGVFEQFEKSLQYFTNETALKWRRKIEVKRVTFKRPNISEVTDEVRNLIIKNNALDLELYNYCLEKFNSINKKTKPLSIKFIKDKYNHVIPYCAKRNLFEFCINNKKFLKSHFQFFKELNFFLLDEKKIRNGKDFTFIWNMTFLKAIDRAFPNSELHEVLVNSVLIQNNEDPLEDTFKIGEALDNFFEQEKNKALKYYSPFPFTKDLVVEVPQKSFLNKLFGR